jgi:hypothetical protein
LPCFSVKFAHFVEHFTPKTPMYLECTIRNTFLTNINLGRLSDIASHCKKKYIYFIEITFLSQFCLFNTLFQVYPTTARMKNFAGLVKRHLAGNFCGYRPLTAWF